MYVLYVYVYLFLKNAKLQPSACETVPSLSVSLSLSHLCILWPQTQHVLYVHMGVMMPWLVGGGGYSVVGCVKVPTWNLCLWSCFLFVFVFFGQFCLIKLDNCTVLMTSSNMLSINVTKSNLDIKCVHEWYTPLLFHCVCVWMRVCLFYFCLFVCMCEF